MADAKPFGGATGAAILGAGAVAVAGLVWYMQQAPAPVDPATETQAAETSPAVQPTAPAAAEKPAPQPPVAPETTAPKFDTVRVSPDPQHPGVNRPLLPNRSDIKEMQTLGDILTAAAKLNFGF